MTIQALSKNQYNTNSSSNDELLSSTQMLNYEKEYERTEEQIIHLEKVFKSHLSLIDNLSLENRKK